MRLITGGILHETHTFAQPETTGKDFETLRGEEAWSRAGSNTSLGGVIDRCRDHGIDLVPTLAAHGGASGLVTRDTFETLLDELLARIAAALPADGMVLTLHGAMVADGYSDAEAEIARRVRDLAGPGVPIAVTLDLHANIGPDMVAACDIVTTYDTYPHIDAAARAAEAVDLLARTIRGEIRPTMALVKPPLLPVPQAQFTAKEPMRSLYARAFAYEDSGEALSVTIAPGFAYSDVPIAGMSFLAVTDNDQAAAERIALDLARMAWHRREQFAVANVPPAEAVRQAIAWPEHPVVLVDVGDNIGGGTPGDGTVLLQELRDQGAEGAVVVIADPEAVRAAFATGVGGAFAMAVGGKTDRWHGDPVEMRGTVRLLCDGHWVHEGPESAGAPVEMGPTAVVRCGGIDLVLTSVKTAPGDLQQLKSVGIDPARQAIIVVKAAVRWRGGYAPITRHSIDVDTPGLGSVELARFPFQALNRPIAPLDPDATWSLAET